MHEAIEPELTDEEIEADYLDHLLQTAPPIVWECYCERDNECHVCREGRIPMLRVDLIREAIADLQ